MLLFCCVCILLASVGCGTRLGNGGGSAEASLPTPSTVTSTSHPLVAQYTIPVRSAAQVTVEFGTDTSYGRHTASATLAVGGGTAQILVAGMRANTTYHMRARVDLASGLSIYDSDHTFTTGALPQASFPTTTVTPAGLARSGGVELLCSVGLDVSAVVLDTDGSVIWYYYDPNLPRGTFAFPIRQLDNGHFLIGFVTEVREVDLEGRIVRSITLGRLNTALAAAGYPLNVYSIHHDVLGLRNGHWILLVNELRDFQDLQGLPGTTSVMGDALVDVDTNNQPVWVWDSFDHLDINRRPYQFPDWTHSNAIVYAPDGSLLLSMRNQSWIIKIDYADGGGSGDVLWRLGSGGDFTLSDSDPAQWFYDQHFPVLLQSQGSSLRLALYDNGNNRPDGSGQYCEISGSCYSRAVMIDADESALTAKIPWQYSPGFYSFWGGSIGVLPNGNVEFDSSSVNGRYSRVLEVTSGSAPQIVWQMDAVDSNFYRGYRIPSLYSSVKW